MTKRDAAPSARSSPLYTSKVAELAKRKIIKEFGKDADGAYRCFGRIDKQSLLGEAK